MYAELLKWGGNFITFMGFLGAVLYFMQWRTRSRRLRNRLRDIYGAECCDSLRQANLYVESAGDERGRD